MSRANIEAPDGGLFPAATIMVRRNVLTIKPKNAAEFQDPTVQKAIRLSRNHWRVLVDTGIYDVERDRDCGCTGSR